MYYHTRNLPHQEIPEKIDATQARLNLYLFLQLQEVLTEKCFGNLGYANISVRRFVIDVVVTNRKVRAFGIFLILAGVYLVIDIFG